MTDLVLGYASKTDAVLALKGQGKAPAEIGRMLGIPTKNVSALASSALRRGVQTPKQPNGDTGAEQMIAVIKALPIDVRESLSRQARKRDTTLSRLVLDLLTTIALDGLVNAVLDDGGAA
jgi:hypothetical protein